MFEYDNKENLIYFKTYDYFAELLVIATMNKNGTGKIILSLSGLNELAENASIFLDPYTYNGKWENNNVQYNPKNFFFNVYPELDDEHKFLFLKNIIEKVDLGKKLGDTCKLDNYLNLYGYKLIEKDSLTTKGYSIKKNNFGLIKRESDISLLEIVIKRDHPDSFRFLDEAISNFGNAEYKSCIDNTRSLLETIVNDFGKKTFQINLLHKSNEQILNEDGVELRSQKKIFEHWLTHKNGANRYRLFSTVYSALSGLGTHGEDIPDKSDALMFLRIVEDILVWMLL